MMAIICLSDDANLILESHRIKGSGNPTCVSQIMVVGAQIPEEYW